VVITTTWQGRPLVLDLEEQKDELGPTTFENWLPGEVRQTLVIVVMRGRIVNGLPAGVKPGDVIPAEGEHFTGRLRIRSREGDICSDGIYRFTPPTEAVSSEQLVKDSLALALMYREAMHGDEVARGALSDWLKERGIIE
jgi:hypothetical protein